MGCLPTVIGHRTSRTLPSPLGEVLPTRRMVATASFTVASSAASASSGFSFAPFASRNSAAFKALAT